MSKKSIFDRFGTKAFLIAVAAILFVGVAAKKALYFFNNSNATFSYSLNVSGPNGVKEIASGVKEISSEPSRRIFLRLCSESEAVMRFPEPVKIRIDDYAMLDNRKQATISRTIRNLSNDTGIVLFPPNMDGGEPNSTIEVVLLPFDTDKWNDPIFNRILEHIAEVQRENNQTSDLNQIGAKIRALPPTGWLNIIVPQNNQPKHLITVFRGTPTTIGMDTLVAVSVIGSLGFNAGAPKIPGTIFALQSLDEMEAALPGKVETAYLKAVYQDKHPGNMLCRGKL